MKKAPLLGLILAAFLHGSLRAAEDSPVLERRLDNGLTLLVVPRTSVPVASCRLVLRGGPAADPAGLEGLADLLRLASDHGTRHLGVSDAAEEESIREIIRRQEEGLRNQRASMSEDLLRRMKEFPDRIRVAREEILSRLAALAAAGNAPMARPEMDTLLRFLLARVEAIDRLAAEWAELRETPDFFLFNAIHDLERKIQEDVARLQGLVTPDPVRTAYQAHGAITSASATLPDALLFSAEIPAQRAELFFWIESSRMGDPAFRFFPEERALAAGRILQRRRSPLPGDAEAAVAFPGHAYGRPPCGDSGSLTSLEPDAAAAAARLLFSPERAAVIVVGDVRPEVVVYWAERYFAGIAPAGPLPAPASTWLPSAPLLWFRMARFPSVELLWVLPDVPAADAAALQAFALLLGQDEGALHAATVGAGIASRLEVRFERRALACLLEVHALPCAGKRPAALSLAIREAVGRAAPSPVASADLDRARTAWNVRAADLLDDPRSLADALAAAFAAGDWRAPLPGSLSGIAPEAVARAAKTRLGVTTPAEILTEGD
jgi:predicted Zn-dependent peptidase